MHTIQLDEANGDITLDIPDYEEEDVVHPATLVFMAIAEKLSDDEEWVEALLNHATEQVKTVQ